MVWNLISRHLFKRGSDTAPQADKTVVKGFRKRYARFRKLLDANAALADVLSDMEEKLDGKSLFGALYVRHMAQKAVSLTRRMAVSLEGMHPGRHRGLEAVIEKVEEQLTGIAGMETDCREQCRELTLSLSEVDLSMVDWVGGKCANLGEMRSMAQVPVPRGFAVTITAFHRFFAETGLDQEIEKKLSTINGEDREALATSLEEVRTAIENAPLPGDLLKALDDSWKRSFGDDDVRLAVRSSAQSEDGDKSFAGQFLSVLNVGRADLAASYKRVVASLFTPSATLYRLHQGIPLSASAMAVACIEMVRAVASGVAYSHDPVNLLADTLLINGIWGLGPHLVDGIVPPDMWVLTREEKPVLVRRRVGNKDRRLTIGGSGELVDQEVPEAERRLYCLSEKEVEELAVLVMRLEKHYGGYQDVEWARDPSGKLILLQSRPLDTRGGGGKKTPKTPLLDNYPLLLEGGDVAYPGIGHGLVVMPRTSEDLLQFPKGGVLVALHSSAEYASVMDRAEAVVTETGGVTGHMATICREYRVPTLLNVPKTMQTLRPGMEVTVDAFSGRVYQGKAEELMPMRMSLDPVRLQDTPVFAMLRQAAQLILPLNLTDPNSARFTPAGCETLHDVMRYAHEFSYHEMFAISDSAVDAGSVALKLKATLPIDLHIIDLDNGTSVRPGARVVLPEEILCVPLKALLKGMLHPAVVFRRPRPINMGGFMSVMGQQMINPQGGDGRFGDKSYAIISDRYMNFSSRVGYHYSVLDAYCGKTQSKNYISFNFQGGAAGEERRARRCRAIALVLEDMGFSVSVKNDAVKSRFQKYDREQIEDRLDQLGRLLQVTRQMDMLMINDGVVHQFREDFRNGVYR